MLFNFNNEIKADLKGIQEYLKANHVELSDDENNALNSIFMEVDQAVHKKGEQGYNDNQLDFREQMVFIKKLKNFRNDIKKHIQNFLFTITRKQREEKEIPAAVLDALRVDKTAENIKASNIKTEVEDPAVVKHREIKGLIQEEASKQSKKLSDGEMEYWTNIVQEVSDTYNIPPALLIAIIGRETKFSKNINAANGAGPMQVTSITIQDFFPKVFGSRTELYKMLNEDLLNDIIYKKDSNGNFVKDAKGNKILKYKSVKELRDACAKDDKLGVQVGLLCFEMKYVEVLSKQKGLSIKKTIEKLNNHEIKLSENEQRSVIGRALKRYNSVFGTYAGSVLDSLQKYNFPFDRQLLM